MRSRYSFSGISREGWEDEDINPIASVSNMADVMLVFACGIMMSLVMFWNVDIGMSAQEVTPTEEMEEVEEMDQIRSDLENGESGYTELGQVYRDPKTGKLYMLSDADVADLVGE